MVRTQRQNRDKIESGEWSDDDVFAEAYRQAAAYAGRAMPDPSTRPNRELIAWYSINHGVPLLELNTVERAFVPSLDDDFEPVVIPGINDDASALPWREYRVYQEGNHLSIDLRWRPQGYAAYDERQARDYIEAKAPAMLEVADRLADEHPSMRANIEGKVAYLRDKFGIVA